MNSRASNIDSARFCFYYFNIKKTIIKISTTQVEFIQFLSKFTQFNFWI